MNKPLSAHIVVFLALVSFFLSSCGAESKKGEKIPAVPEITAKARRLAAIDFLTNVINNTANSSDAYYKRSLLYMEDERYNEALNDINDAINIKPNIGSYFQAKAVILRAFSHPREALAAASRAEALNIESPELFTLLGDLYQQIGQYNKARLYLRKALQVSPNNGETYFYQGEIAAKQGDTTNALQLYQVTLTLKPSFVPAYLKLMDVHTALKEYDLALFYGNEALKYKPKNAEIYFRRGITFHRVWRTDSALVSFKKAVQLDSSMAKASFYAGIIYFKSHAFKLALPYFEHTFKRNAKYPDVRFYVAQCLEYTGQFEEAEKLYTVLVAENGSDYRSLNGLYRVKRKLLYGVGTYIPDMSLEYDSTATLGKESPKRSVDTSLKALVPKSKLSIKTDSTKK